MSHVMLIGIWWITGTLAVGVLWVIGRGVRRLSIHSLYWHAQWMELGQEHAKVLDQLANALETNRVLESRLRDEQVRPRESAHLHVPIVWQAAPERMVPSRGAGTTVLTVPRVSEALGQCAPGAASGGGGEGDLPYADWRALETTERFLSAMPPTVDESISRGPQGSDRERGEARGIESPAPTPAVQSTEGESVAHSDDHWWESL